METSKLPESYKEYIAMKKEYHARIRKQLRKKQRKQEDNDDGGDKAKKTKIKCVNCNRNVGMIFEEKDGIHFKAKCGDTKNPCALDLKASLPKYTRIIDRLQQIGVELNTVLGRLKNMKTRIMYTQEVEKKDPKMFTSLKKEAISLMKENRDLRQLIPQYPMTLKDTGVIPEDFFKRLEYYENNKEKLQDYYVFERPNAEYDEKLGKFVYADDEENVTTLFSNLDFLVKEN